MKSLSIIISALRKGTSLPNVTGWKWTGIAVVMALTVLKLVQSFGYLMEISDDSLIELIGLLVTLYLSVATTDRVGLPSKRVPDQPVQTKRDEPDGYWSRDARGPFDDH